MAKEIEEGKLTPNEGRTASATARRSHQRTLIVSNDNIVKKIQIRILLGDYKNCFF